MSRDEKRHDESEISVAVLLIQRIRSGAILAIPDVVLWARHITEYETSADWRIASCVYRKNGILTVQIFRMFSPHVPS